MRGRTIIWFGESLIKPRERVGGPLTLARERNPRTMGGELRRATSDGSFNFTINDIRIRRTLVITSFYAKVRCTHGRYTRCEQIPWPPPVFVVDHVERGTFRYILYTRRPQRKCKNRTAEAPRRYIATREFLGLGFSDKTLLITISRRCWWLGCPIHVRWFDRLS